MAGKGAAYGNSDCAVVKAATKILHSITRRPHRTRLPQTKQERAAPLHVSSISPMDVGMLQQRMLPRVRQRFNDVWDLVFQPALSKKARAPKPSRLQHAHAEELVRCGIAQPATDDGLASNNVPFTVIEDKPAGLRQRFILWTKEANDWVEQAGYEARVPLGHVSKYLDVVRAECGSTRDFKTGFFAVEIPTVARCFFRFTDDKGKLYELTRLPMGHTCAPELMHTLAAVAAGDPLFVVPEFAAKGVGIHVWVDNIRYTGSQEAVSRATNRLDSTAELCRITWKTEDSVTCGTEYDFIGVTFDHGTGTVAPSAKLVRKLTGLDLERARAGDLESLAGRLLHASSIAGVSPGEYWFALKFLRRVTNKLNAGRASTEDWVPVPPSVKALLGRWIADVQKRRKIEAMRMGGPKFTAFVDASLGGWGGVVVDQHTMEVTILGDAWKPGTKDHINILEAEALARVVEGLPPHAVAGHVDIRVDNTTVMGVARKMSCVRSRSLNDAAMRALRELRRRRLTFSIEWVSTSSNPADIPSRTHPSELADPDVVLAVRALLRAEGVVV